MIIPIRPPSDTTLQNQCGGKVDNVEWVMIELNGELLKPLEDNKTEDIVKNEESSQMELGSVKFDADVSKNVLAFSFINY